MSYDVFYIFFLFLIKVNSEYDFKENTMKRRNCLIIWHPRRIKRFKSKKMITFILLNDKVSS